MNQNNKPTGGENKPDLKHQTGETNPNTRQPAPERPAKGSDQKDQKAAGSAQTKNSTTASTQKKH